MKRYGYHRTSTKEQHLDRGILEITKYCSDNNLELEKIFTDQQTGKNFNRPRYQVLKEDVLRPGDELIVTGLDRLGRNKQEILKELQYFRDMGVRVKVLELPTTLVDLSAMDNTMACMILETINSMLIKLYATMAQAEIEKKEKRQKEGIETKKLQYLKRQHIKMMSDKFVDFSIICTYSRELIMEGIKRERIKRIASLNQLVIISSL